MTTLEILLGVLAVLLPLITFLLGKWFEKRRLRGEKLWLIRRDLYNKISKAAEELYKTMHFVSGELAYDQPFRLTLYLFYDEATIDQPTIRDWDEIIKEVKQAELEEFRRIQESDHPPRHLREFYFELFNLRNDILFASDDIRILWTEMLGMTVSFFDDIRAICRLLIPGRKETGSKGEFKVGQRLFGDQGPRQELRSLDDIEITERANEFNIKIREFHEKVASEIGK